jgi:hypothetical protein
MAKCGCVEQQGVDAEEKRGGGFDQSGVVTRWTCSHIRRQLDAISGLGCVYQQDFPVLLKGRKLSLIAPALCGNCATFQGDSR